MNLPVFLPPPDGSTSEQMKWDGRVRVAEQKHRLRLLYAHSYGKHTQIVEGCQECGYEIALLCAEWYEPRPEAPRGFA